MDTIVKGIPKAQKRHRHTKKGWAYDPSKKDKADFLFKALASKPEKPYEICSVNIVFSFPRPKSHYRTGRNCAELRQNAPFKHTSRPDVDNLLKFVFDALNRHFWNDDSVIYKVEASKVWGEAQTIIKIGE